MKKRNPYLPKIEALNKFAQHYFKSDPPEVVWREGLKNLGEVDTKDKKIYVNPKHPVRSKALLRDIKRYVYEATVNRMGQYHWIQNEQVFLTLLRQIEIYKICVTDKSVWDKDEDWAENELHKHRDYIEVLSRSFKPIGLGIVEQMNQDFYNSNPIYKQW